MWVICDVNRQMGVAYLTPTWHIHSCRGCVDDVGSLSGGKMDRVGGMAWSEIVLRVEDEIMRKTMLSCRAPSECAFSIANNSRTLLQ